MSIDNQRYLWLDYEGYGWFESELGNSRGWDRPSQLAARFTDSLFNHIGPATNIHCRPSLDHVPSPGALLITKNNPYDLESRGLCEYDFARKALSLFSSGNTCVIGYNSHGYDHQITRYLMHRNLIDPWGWQWKNKNSHWDAQYIVQTCWALRPNALQWPEPDEKGGGRLKLDRLSVANGIEHQNAHDALSDVDALIGLIRIIAKSHPGLIPELNARINKRKTKRYLDRCATQFKPLVYINGLLGYNRQFMTICMPITMAPNNANRYIAVDLNLNLDDVFTLEPDELKERLYMPKKGLTDGMTRPGIIAIRLNETPVLLEQMFLKGKVEETGLNQALILRNIESIKSSKTIVSKLKQMYLDPYEPRNDLDEDIDMFRNDSHDINVCIDFHHADVNDKFELNWQFEDKRFHVLKERLLARNWPERLSTLQKRNWSKRCQWVFEKQYPSRQHQLETMKANPNLNETDKSLLMTIEDYWMEMRNRIESLAQK